MEQRLITGSCCFPKGGAPGALRGFLVYKNLTSRSNSTHCCDFYLRMGIVSNPSKAGFSDTSSRIRALDKAKELSRLFLCVVAIVLAGPAAAQVSPIDTAGSKLLVHVSKSGVFSGFADNHEVEAPISEGTIDEKGARASFSVDSRRMKVLDPQLPADKRQQVQERMLGPEVLDSTRFPKITFESSHVELDREGKIRIEGRLSLHGVTKPVSVAVQAENGRYIGSFALKQSDYGISPVSIAGGTVKVKDELTIEFDIRITSGVSK